MTQIYMHQFRVVRPAYERSQASSLAWLEAAHALAYSYSDSPKESFASTIRKLMDRYACSPEKIQFRSSVCSDFTHLNWSDMEIYNLSGLRLMGGMECRMNVYLRESKKLLNQLYAEVKSAPHEMIHVSCTGYVSPSPVQQLVAEKDWSSHTLVTHAYHMGCYAAMPSVRMACGSLLTQLNYRKSVRTVDVVHTELCSLHFDPFNHAPDQLVVQSLFSDGAVKYTLTTQQPSGSSLKFLGFNEEILPHSADAMTWACADWGMKMTLSKSVPELIATKLKKFVTELLDLSGVSSSKEHKIFYAVHPGGPKIIDKAQEILEASQLQVQHSQQILASCGNMSSATLPHVWDKMLQDPLVPSGSTIVSLAFGPGLSLCGAVFEKVVV